MQFLTWMAGAGAACLVLIACTDSTSPTIPEPLLAVEVSGPATVELLDKCDPATFNAALGAGACVGNGTVTFEAFLAELGATHRVATWRMTPRELVMHVGETLTAINRGGEAHTFTEVARFGGGIVSELNDLMGLTEVAPECLQLAPEDFLAPGSSDSEVEDDAGVERYQCCLHPWMKSTVIVR